MTEMMLRDGSLTLDPRLDAIFDKDPQNWDYRAGALMPEQVVHQSRAWTAGPVTDQGQEGACVGHACTGCLMCEPHLSFGPLISPPGGPDAYAFELYHEIQDNDDWPGCSKQPNCTVSPASENYGGTSVKAAGKVLVARGLLTEYRWAMGLDETLATLATVGPVVLAIPWFESMYETQNGMVVVSGKQVGRHAILLPQVDFEAREVEWQNSWGLKYGKNGRARLSFDTLGQLLAQQGEVFVPIKKAA